jgi:hypothetical protein
MPREVEHKLKSAILNKRLIEFEYGGFKRIGEPHVLGTRHGVMQLLLYQLGGGSSSGGKLPQWRRLNVSEMSKLKVTDQSFYGARQSPSGQHSGFDRIILSVAPATERPIQA